MATAHVYPFETVRSGTHYDSDPFYKSPVTAPGAVTTDDRQATSASRYPAPLRADLVTLWKRNGTTVLSITADGKVHDFHLPPARLVVLLREVAEQLAENSILQ